MCIRDRLDIGDNLVNHSDDYGIYVYSYNPTTRIGSSADNSVDNSGDGDSGFSVPGSFTGALIVNGVSVPAP